MINFKVYRANDILRLIIFFSLLCTALIPVQANDVHAGEINMLNVDHSTPQPGNFPINTDQVNNYLPLVLRRFPAPLQVFGMETIWYQDKYYNAAREAKIKWLRTFAFSWDKIEPDYYDVPVYNWNEVNEQSLKSAYDNGFTVIGVINKTPTWAQKKPGYTCSAPKAENIDEFARFVKQLVLRYSAPPYNIKYWEIGNEPDIDPGLVPPDNHFGCWGDDNDAYYGGGYYADILKAVYPAIKSADAGASVLIGGLLLNCDPTNPPPNTPQDFCKPGKYFEGMLRNQGGAFFDIVSFHGYAYFDGNRIIDEDLINWKVRGGVVMGKINFLQQVMSTYNINKPIFHTEGSLICPHETVATCDPNHADFGRFLEAQADYVYWLYLRNIDAGIMGSIWYTLQPGWRSCGLFHTDGSPKPSYYAYRFLSQTLSDAYYLGRVTQYPDLRGYQFEYLSNRLWILYAPDRANHVITLPAKFVRAYDKYGNLLNPTNNQLTVNSPVILEVMP